MCKRILFLTVSLNLLFTACSPKSDPSASRSEGEATSAPIETEVVHTQVFTPPEDSKSSSETELATDAETTEFDALDEGPIDYKNLFAHLDSDSKQLRALSQQFAKGSTTAASEWARLFLKNPRIKTDFSKARSLLRTAAENGDTLSLVALAELLGSGRGGEIDKEAAFLALQEAYDAGETAALVPLAEFIESGEYTDQDFSFAASLYEKAIDAGHKEAFAKLSKLYERGIGIEQNTEKAISLLMTGAKKGDPLALKNLASYYADGTHDLDIDLGKAFNLIRQAARQGDPEAMYQIAEFMGRHSEFRNEENVLAVLTSAHKLGSDSASVRLAKMILNRQASGKEMKGTLAKLDPLEMLLDAVENGSHLAVTETISVLSDSEKWGTDFQDSIISLMEEHLANGGRQFSLPLAKHYLESNRYTEDEKSALALAVLERKSTVNDRHALRLYYKEGYKLSDAIEKSIGLNYQETQNQRHESENQGKSRVAPRVLKTAEPIYPESLYLQKEAGFALVEFVVTKDGSVIRPKTIESSNPLFNVPAEQSLLKWEFEPAFVDGMPMNTKLRLKIQFSNNNAPKSPVQN